MLSRMKRLLRGSGQSEPGKLIRRLSDALITTAEDECSRKALTFGVETSGTKITIDMDTVMNKTNKNLYERVRRRSGWSNVWTIDVEEYANSAKPTEIPIFLKKVIVGNQTSYLTLENKAGVEVALCIGTVVLQSEESPVNRLPRNGTISLYTNWFKYVNLSGADTVHAANMTNAIMRDNVHAVFDDIEEEQTSQIIEIFKSSNRGNNLVCFAEDRATTNNASQSAVNDDATPSSPQHDQDIDHETGVHWDTSQQKPVLFLPGNRVTDVDACGGTTGQCLHVNDNPQSTYYNLAAPAPTLQTALTLSVVEVLNGHMQGGVAPPSNQLPNPDALQSAATRIAAHISAFSAQTTLVRQSLCAA